MSVVGSITITDRASGVLKNLQKEQTSFRKDVTATGKELNRTWGKTYKAKLDTGTAAGKAAALTKTIQQVGNTTASPVIQAKDAATGTVKKVASQMKAAEKTSVSPVIRVKDTATSTISKITGGLKAAGKIVVSPAIRVKDAATKTISKVTGGLKAAGKMAILPVIRVKDAATKTISKVTSGLKAVGKIAVTPIVRLKDATAAGLSSISGKLKSLGTSVVIPVTAAVSVASTAVIGGAVSQGAKLEQSIGGVETLFKDDAGVVKANADAAFKTAGLSANEYMEQVTSFSASLISSLKNDTAKAASVADMAMVDMADNANKFGTEIGSIQNAYQGFAKQNYTMLDNLKLGYGGTKEEMERLLDDAQKLTGVKYDIDNLSDVYNAIHAIQENLGVTGTTAKEASETFSGSFTSMKSAWKNLLGNMAVGGDVTGSVSELLNTTSTFLLGNAVPMLGRVASALPGAVVTAIRSGGPRFKAAGQEVVQGIKDGVINALPSSMQEPARQLVAGLGNIGSGFAALKPQLSAFGSSTATAFRQAVGASVPVLSSMVTTVQTTVPAVLPVIQTAMSNISGFISAAAPIISGLVTGIGTAVTTLAPVFNTIFGSIGQKVNTVVGLVGERMGFIQEVISTAAPAISTVLSTAWGVISPVLDIMVTTFDLVLDVVEAVWPTVRDTIQGVWNVLEPIFGAIGKGAEMLSSAWSKVKNLITGSGSSNSGTGGKEKKPGKNARGDNNWRGGPTWVGEQGPELIDLPRGTRILPRKESVAWAIRNERDNILPFPARPASANIRNQGNLGFGFAGAGQAGGRSVVIQINKIADQVTVRSDQDVDDIAERTAKKILEALDNTA